MERRPQGTGSIYRRGKIWHIQYFRHGQRQRESSGSTEREDAERLLHRRLGLQQLTPEKATMGDLIDLVIEDYEFRGLRSVATVKWRAEANLRPVIGAMPAAKFGSSDLKWYVAKRRKAGAENATINRELAIIGRGLTLAAEADPPVIVRRIRVPHLEEDNVRQGFLEPDQYEALLRELPERLKALFVVGYHVGGRKGELRRIQWDQVDFAGGGVRLERKQTKGKRPRILPIYGDMESWLRRQREGCPQSCPWVFFYRGRPVGAQLAGWREACERAGLSGLLFHDLRRSAVRNMKRAGLDDKIAMQISGHKTRSMYDRYNIVSEEDLGDAAAKLQEYLKEHRKPKPPAKLKRVK